MQNSDFNYIIKIYNGEYLGKSKINKKGEQKDLYPFVEIIVDNQYKIGQTKIIKKSLFPVWNEEFEINTNFAKLVQFKVFHKSELIGIGNISLVNFIFESVQKVNLKNY